MKTLPKRLNNAYLQIQQSRLINKNQNDQDAINHFENLLNSSLPQTEYENHIYYFVKDLFHSDNDKFNKYINDNESLKPLILYTNNLFIISHFNLKYKVYISWNKITKKYQATKFIHNINKDNNVEDNNTEDNNTENKIVEDNNVENNNVENNNTEDNSNICEYTVII
jgi:hypothetical protein